MARPAASRDTDEGPIETSPDAPPDAIELLVGDHRAVEALFEAYEALDDDDEKAELAERICFALKVHTEIEEEIFYPEARDASGEDDLLDEAAVEHGAAKTLIEEIEAGEPGDDLFDARIRVLGEYIRHHVQEEENELFPAVLKAKLDLKEMGLRLLDLKKELMEEMAEEEA